MVQTASAAAGTTPALARLRGGSRTATRNPESAVRSTSSGSVMEPQEIDPGLCLSFTSMRVREFDCCWRPTPGYRIDGGEVWHLITPELLGWMSQQVERQFRAATVTDPAELGAAVLLLQQALDASGLMPVAPVDRNWTPPGRGLRVPDLSVLD